MDNRSPAAIAHPFDLTGKLAWVIGAGRGIGATCATELAAAGAEVVAMARTLADVEELADTIAASGGRGSAVAVDAADIEAAQETYKALPAPNIVVYSAGTNRPKPMAETTKEDVDVLFEVNVKGAYFAYQSATAAMMGAGTGGSLIGISSQMGHVGAKNRTVYCASKWALEGLTKATAVELAPHGIRVNTIAPTFIETDMTRKFFEDENFRTEVMDQIKLGRLATNADLTGALLLLASDASSMITGTSIVVDGGWTSH